MRFEFCVFSEGLFGGLGLGSWAAEDVGDGDVVAGEGVGEAGGGGIGLVGAGEEFAGAGGVVGFFVEGGDGEEDAGVFGVEGEGFFVVDEGVVEVAEGFVGAANAEAVAGLAEVEGFFGLFLVTEFGFGFFDAGIFDFVGHGAGAFEIIEGEIGLVEFDEGSGEAVFGFAGRGIGLEGDFEVVGGLFVVALAVLDEAGVGVADGIELVVGEGFVERGEGLVVVAVLVEFDALVAVFLDIAFAGGEQGEGERQRGGEEQSTGGMAHEGFSKGLSALVMVSSGGGIARLDAECGMWNAENERDGGVGVGMRVRFVVLHHTGVEEPHFDLMVEVSGREGGGLLTWRVGSSPEVWGSAEHGEIGAVRIGDHRAVYLTYEGEISGGRGAVRRVAEGRGEILDLREGAILVELMPTGSDGSKTPGLWRLRLPRVL